MPKSVLQTDAGWITPLCMNVSSKNSMFLEIFIKCILVFLNCNILSAYVSSLIISSPSLEPNNSISFSSGNVSNLSTGDLHILS